MGEIEYLKEKIKEVQQSIMNLATKKEELEAWEEINLSQLRKEFIYLHSIANMVCCYRGISFKEYIGE